MARLSGGLLATIGVLNESMNVEYKHDDMSLHKVLYYVRGWMLALDGEAPFEEKITVNARTGPIISELFQWADALNEGEGPVMKPHGTRSGELLEAINCARKLKPSHERGIRAIHETVGARDGMYLSEITQRDWCVAETPAGEQIDDEALKQRFVEVATAEDLKERLIRPVLEDGEPMFQELFSLLRENELVLKYG